MNYLDSREKNIKNKSFHSTVAMIIFGIFFLILGIIILHNQKVVAQTPPTTLTCGQIITGTVVMSGNLDCSSYTGHALIISGNSSLDLNGYTITATGTYAGVYANGVSNTTITSSGARGTINSPTYSIYLNTPNAGITSGVTIKNLNLSKPTGAKAGYGIYSRIEYGYTTKNLNIENLIINNRDTAFYLHRDSDYTDYQIISISGVVATGNTNGLQISRSPNQTRNNSGLKLLNNDFSFNTNGVSIADTNNVLVTNNIVRNNANTNGISLRNIKGILPTSAGGDFAFDLRNNTGTIINIMGMNNINLFGPSSDVTLPSTGLMMTEGTNTGGWKILFDNNTTIPIYLDTNIGATTSGVTIKNLNLSKATGARGGNGIFSRIEYGYTTYNLNIENLIINNRDTAIYLHRDSHLTDYENVSISGIVASGNTNGLQISKTPTNTRNNSGLQLFNNNFSSNTNNGVLIEESNNIEVANNTIKNNTSYGIIINTITNLQFYSNIISGNTTFNFFGDTGYTLGINERGHIYNSGSCFSRFGFTVGGIPADANRSDIIAPPICAATTLSCLGGCGFITRSNVVQNFDYGVFWKQSITPGNTYPLMLLFTNTSVSSVNKIPLPGGFILPVTPIAPGASSNINLNIKYFLP